jgi:hypothetical protein
MAIRTTDVPMVPVSASLGDSSNALDRVNDSDYALARTIVKSRLHPINMMIRRQDIILASQDLNFISLFRRQKPGISAFSPVRDRGIQAGPTYRRSVGLHAIV